MKERQTELLDRLIVLLCAERGETPPSLNDEEKADYFRALCNIRPPQPISEEFLRLQDAYLSACTAARGVVDVADLEFHDKIALWQGDITRLNTDAIVNACNAALLGCFRPLHHCIDNLIHSRAGVQVRLECAEIMRGGQEKNGRVRVTSAHNLPSAYIFHTVGPIADGSPDERDRSDLASCYRSCMEKATEMRLDSIAFCCISTGVYGFPNEEACAVAVDTVRDYLTKNPDAPKVVFDVFLDKDAALYRQKLGDEFRLFAQQ